MVRLLNTIGYAKHYKIIFVSSFGVPKILSRLTGKLFRVRF